MRHFTDWVEIHRAEIVADAYTNHRDWDSASVVWSGWASIQPATADESESPTRETTADRITVFLPPTAVVDAMDRLVVDGTAYLVRDNPRPWKQGSLAHIYLKAWRVQR